MFHISCIAQEIRRLLRKCNPSLSVMKETEENRIIMLNGEKTAQTLCVPLLGDCVSLVLSVNEPTLCRKTLNKHSGISGLRRNIMTGLHYLKLQVSPMQK